MKPRITPAMVAWIPERSTATQKPTASTKYKMGCEIPTFRVANMIARMTRAANSAARSSEPL